MKNLLLGLFAVIAVTGNADPASVHGMLIFGQEKIYVSHLPMFHNPHDYQVIMEVELEPAAKAEFVQHQIDNPKVPYYTLVPESFVLPDRVKSMEPFSAELVSGHFERLGHKSLIKDTTVRIAKVIYFTQLNPKTTAPKKLQYLAFGRNTETFLAHFITGKPDFDHVLQVAAKGPALQDLIAKSSFVHLEFPALGNKTPLKAGEKVTVVGNPGAGSIEIVKDLYTEFGDLSH